LTIFKKSAIIKLQDEKDTEAKSRRLEKISKENQKSP
jgi:hypothetical protein